MGYLIFYINSNETRSMGRWRCPQGPLTYMCLEDVCVGCCLSPTHPGTDVMILSAMSLDDLWPDTLTCPCHDLRVHGHKVLHPWRDAFTPASFHHHFWSGSMLAAVFCYQRHWIHMHNVCTLLCVQDWCHPLWSRTIIVLFSHTFVCGRVYNTCITCNVM